MKWTHHPPNLWTCGRFTIDRLPEDHSDVGRYYLLKPDSANPMSRHHTLADAMSEAEKMESAA